MQIILNQRTVSCGTMALGQTRNLGGTIYGAQGGIQDYSRKETDEFGNYTLVERAYAKRISYRVVRENTQIDVFNALADVGSDPRSGSEQTTTR